MNFPRLARSVLLTLPYLTYQVQAQPTQDPWTAFLARHRNDQREGPLWRLLTTEEFGPWTSDPALLRLRAGKDLSIERLEAGLSQSLARREGWAPGPRWLLLSPEGRIVVSASGTPAGTTVATALKDAGLRSRYQIIETFLSI